MTRLSDAQARHGRFRAQLLGGARRTRSAAEVARAVCGIQAQDTAAAALSVRARSARLTRGSLEHELTTERSVVRTWAMRGTLHWLAAEDVGWLLELFGARFQASSRRRRLQLGLDDDATEAGVRALRALLAEHGPLTRADIVERLAARGVHVRGQARPHLLAYAALGGVVCHGPDRDREPTYVLLRDWVGAQTSRPLERDAALAELARRYVRAFGPARP